MSTVSPILSRTPTSAPSEELRRATSVAPAEGAASESGNEQSFSFSDFLSIINPLQHIPIVGSIYRAITGDTIKPAARVIGGALFGGPVGLIASAFNAMIEQTKGKDLGDQAIALFVPDKGSAPSGDPATQFAKAADPEPQPEIASSLVTDDAIAANPPSRNLFTRASATSAAATPLVGPDRTLGTSLVRGGHSNTTPNATQGRTLADYRNFSGRPLPVVDGTRSAGNHAAPVRLQPTVPLAEKPRVLPAASESPAVRDTSPVEPVIDAKADTATVGMTPAPASEWFTSAMARGLDRYREQRRQTAPIQIDTAL